MPFSQSAYQFIDRDTHTDGSAACADMDTRLDYFDVNDFFLATICCHVVLLEKKKGSTGIEPFSSDVW
jgi:hypothetical protein